MKPKQPSTKNDTERHGESIPIAAIEDALLVHPPDCWFINREGNPCRGIHRLDVATLFDDGLVELSCNVDDCSGGTVVPGDIARERLEQVGFDVDELQEDIGDDV